MDHDYERGGFTLEQAEQIASVLTTALNDEVDVVVHCVAGLCGSGAVAEVGVMMGFIDAHAVRQPNIRVKSMLINTLGWGYDDC